ARAHAYAGGGREDAVDEDLLTVRVAELYYDEAKTQDEIGALLKISRWKVGRLLTNAREKGIVRIEIVHPRARKLGLERELAESFGLVDAVIVPAPEDETTTLDRVAQAAADHLAAHRPVPRTLSVRWGRTPSAVAEALPGDSTRRLHRAPLNGGGDPRRRAGRAARLALT